MRAAGLAVRVTYQDFSSTIGLNVVGTAVKDDGAITLSGTHEGDVGAVWLEEPVDLFEEITHLTFAFTIRKGLASRGGEGMAMVLQKASAEATGEDGEGIGYAGIPGGAALEFDTHENSDAGDPHKGNSRNPLAHHVSWLLPLENGGNATSSHHDQITMPYVLCDRELNHDESFTIAVVYVHTGDRKELIVTMDGVDLPLNANASASAAAGPEPNRVRVDLPARLGLEAGHLVRVGFTAATGAHYQRVHLWSLALRQTSDGSDACAPGFVGDTCKPDPAAGDCAGPAGCHACTTSAAPCVWLDGRCERQNAAPPDRGVFSPQQCATSSSYRFLYILLGAALAVLVAYVIVRLYLRRQIRSGNHYAAHALILSDGYEAL